jgi:galactitol-specific phosphotransferase system IIB component
MFLMKLHKAINKFLGIKYYEIPSNRLIRKAMTSAQINSKIESCLAVLDIQHPKQTGLTMRTFEVLASGKKLITTNKSIQNEIFFDPSIIQVIDREKPELDLNFFNNDINRMPDFFFNHYSCKGWLIDIFSDI